MKTTSTRHMQAVTYSHYGSSDTLTISTVDQPALKPGCVLIKNFASSINPIDWKIRSGHLRPLSGFKPPKRCGSDFAGEIIAIADATSPFKIGDKVYGFTNPIKGGGFAEYVVANTKHIAPIPDKLDFIDAGVIPLAALTALDALSGIANLQSGQRVVINGCSGGVGTFAVQIAKALGAHVIGVCSSSNHTLAHSLGADEILDYTTDNHLSGLSNITVFFDAVGTQSLPKVRQLLSPKGIYITTLPSVGKLCSNLFNNLYNKQKSRVVMVKTSGDSLSTINQLITAGKLKPVIEKIFSLTDIKQAQQHGETGRTKGKIAIKIREQTQAFENSVTENPANE